MSESEEFEVVWEMVENYVDAAIRDYVLDIVSNLVVDEQLPFDITVTEAYVDASSQERVLRDKIKSLLEEKQ